MEIELDDLVRNEDFEGIKDYIYKWTPPDTSFLCSAFYNVGNQALSDLFEKYDLALKLYNFSIDLCLQCIGEKYGTNTTSAEELSSYIQEDHDISRQMASVFNNMGTVYKRMRNWEMAVAYYMKAIAVCPTYSIAMLRVAMLMAYVGEKDNALQSYNAYIKMGGKDDVVINSMEATPEGGPQLREILSNNV